MAARSERFDSGAPAGVMLHALRWEAPGAAKLVLLHGGGANAHWWDALAPELARRFDVTALDFRGHGDSDHPDAIVPGAFERDLEALLARLAAPDALLIGHSMGAHVALAHAARAGAAGPAALVLIEPARGGIRSERRRMRLALAARRTYRTREDAIERFRFLPPTLHADEAIRRRVAEHSVRREGDRYGFKFDPRWFTLPRGPRPDLSRVVVPVLVVRGAESALLTAEGARELASELPRARVVEVPGAGHNVHVERPEAFLAAVATFLDATAGGRS